MSLKHACTLALLFSFSLMFFFSYLHTLNIQPPEDKDKDACSDWPTCRISSTTWAPPICRTYNTHTPTHTNARTYAHTHTHNSR